MAVPPLFELVKYASPWNDAMLRASQIFCSSPLVAAVAVLIAPITQADFTVLPHSIQLHGADSSANVIVQTMSISADGEQVTGQQLTRGVVLESSDPNVIRVDGHQVVAVGDGATELIVRVSDQDRIARIPVNVHGAAGERNWQFTAHVQSVLARQGCNSGACHGALAGKGGFRLSLLGYDADLDHFTMTSQDQGRRIEPVDPGRSLLLTKPTMEVAHKGGARLDKGTLEYQILEQWIERGAAGPSPADAALLGVEILPGEFRASIGAVQQFIVRARYEDGRFEDVTRWAKFSSTSTPIATVDSGGQVQIVGPGRVAIVAWFASRIAIATIDVPYLNEHQVAQRLETEANRQAFHPRNTIDQVLLSEWRSLQLAPSPECDDATFLRRVFLDTTGALPDVERVEQFLGCSDPDKRQRVIDELLNSEAYVDYWSYKWSDLLLVNGNLLRPDAVRAFYLWIRSQVERNVGWDQFARDIVLAKGSSVENGATNFYAIHQTPEAMTENTCLAFMGLSIECAKCHNHPLEKWTNDQYYAMANMFSRVRAKGWGGDSRNGDGHRTLVVLERGDVIQPSRGVPQPPAPLDQPALDVNDVNDRRLVLADWLTDARRNDYFARSIVNRVWANYFGRGLVESVDDLRASNPASSERLMTALTDQLIAEQYDLKSLMRTILNSQAYQLSATATDLNRDDDRFFCRHYPRRLMAEVMHDAVVSVTEVPTKFDQIQFSGADKQPTSFYAFGTHSLQLYDSSVANYFLQTFGRNQRRITCECERSDQPTVVQALHLNNGDTVNDKLADPNCIITRWLTENLADEKIVESAYLRSLSRRPNDEEMQRVLAVFADTKFAGDERRQVIEDLLWSLMTSSEFLFTH